MPQHGDFGTFSRLIPPNTPIREVPIMANYQPPHNFALIHPGEKGAGPLSTNPSHPVQHAQGVLDSIPAIALPTQTPAVNEAEETMG